MLIARRFVVPLALAAVVVAACSPAQQTRRAADAPPVTEHAAATVVYRDKDPSAMGYQARPGQEGHLRRSIERALIKDPQNVAALTQRAYWHAQEGESELAQRDYDAAMTASEGHGPNRRRVLWSRGWTRYGEGDIAAAIDDWHQAERLHGGHPAWVPYTYALAYWTLGDRDRAFAWYDVSVASDSRWGGEVTMKKRTHYWKEKEKSQVHALFAAWQASRAQTAASAR